MKIRTLALVTTMFATACSSTSSGGDASAAGGTGATDAGGGGGPAGMGGGGAGTGGPGTAGAAAAGSGGAPQCMGVTGSYAMSRKRDKVNPGSCSPTLSVNPQIPAHVTADPTQPSGYEFELGYSDAMNVVTFLPCTNNVAGCMIFATCQNNAGTTSEFTDQITLALSGNAIAGTLERSYSMMPACTANFDVTGTRQ